MKYHAAWVAILSTIPLAANGMPFHGTITETITSTNDPAYAVGAVFVGSYSYESPTMDGTFYTGEYYPPPNPDALNTLDGLVDLPFATSAEWVFEGTILTETGGFGNLVVPLASTRNGGSLTVADGKIEHFEWSWESNHFYFEMSGNPSQGTFMAYSFDNTALVQTYGTVVFSSVPEITPTIQLIACMVPIALFLRLRRRTLRPLTI